MIRSPLSGWMGGKYLLSKQVVSRIPEHQCYVEPFSGAAWVFFRKDRSKVEVLNDINTDVVTLYRVIQNHMEEFVRYFKWVLPSRNEFQRLLKVDPSTLTDIQRSVRFYYLQKSSFAGRATGNLTWGTAATQPPRINLLRIEQDLSDVHLRLSRVYIENENYSDVINRYDRDKTFIYLDPPYYGCEDYYGKEIFSRDDFQKLSDQLSAIQGKFLLSLNDTPEIREVFRQFEIETVNTRYSCNAERNIKVTELLIRNY